eukprot:m.173502 g.173502  ORF g.173502 m.173502 type:complete len:423 (+) comp13703_c0_seq1:1223-2491(+)
MIWSSLVSIRATSTSAVSTAPTPQAVDGVPPDRSARTASPPASASTAWAHASEDPRAACCSAPRSALPRKVVDGVCRRTVAVQEARRASLFSPPTHARTGAMSQQPQPLHQRHLPPHRQPGPPSLSLTLLNVKTTKDGLTRTATTARTTTGTHGVPRDAMRTWVCRVKTGTLATTLPISPTATELTPDKHAACAVVVQPLRLPLQAPLPQSRRHRPTTQPCLPPKSQPTCPRTNPVSATTGGPIRPLSTAMGTRARRTRSGARTVHTFREHGPRAKPLKRTPIPTVSTPVWLAAFAVVGLSHPSTSRQTLPRPHRPLRHRPSNPRQRQPRRRPSPSHPARRGSRLWTRRMCARLGTTSLRTNSCGAQAVPTRSVRTSADRPTRAGSCCTSRATVSAVSFQTATKMDACLPRGEVPCTSATSE